MRYCKDCRWWRCDPELPSFAKCHSPRNPTDIVSGTPKQPYCDHNRERGMTCGPEARLFEELIPSRRLTFLERLWGKIDR